VKTSFDKALCEVISEGPDEAPRAEVSLRAATAVVRLQSSARTLEARWVRDLLDELIGRGLPSVVIDLSDLDCIWAVAVAVLVGEYCQEPDRRGRVSLVVAQPHVLKALARGGLTEQVAVWGSVDRAAAPDEASEKAPTSRSRRKSTPARRAAKRRSRIAVADADQPRDVAVPVRRADAARWRGRRTIRVEDADG